MYVFELCRSSNADCVCHSLIGNEQGKQAADKGISADEEPNAKRHNKKDPAHKPSAKRRKKEPELEVVEGARKKRKSRRGSNDIDGEQAEGNSQHGEATQRDNGSAPATQGEMLCAIAKPKPAPQETWLIMPIGAKLKDANNVDPNSEGMLWGTVDVCHEDGSVQITYCEDGLVEDGVSKRRLVCNWVDTD